MAMLTEAVTSILAYLILLLLTPWAIVWLAKDAQAGPLITMYGTILLTNLIAESSTGVLQSQRRFGTIARINIIQGTFTTAIILAAVLTGGGVTLIVAAYTLGKSINGLSLAVLALLELRKTLGSDWWKTPLKVLPDKRGMLLFMLNTNLNGTVILFTRDNIPLYLAALLSTADAGYFKLAQSLINLIFLPLDPLIWPTYTEITRTIAQKQWELTRQLLRRVSQITAAVVLGVGGVLALSGWFLLPLIYGQQALPAYPAMLILLVGYGFANIFQWSRPLLLALGKPATPVLVSLICGVFELALIFLLVPYFGYLALAAILSAYFVFSIGITVWRGLAEMNHQVAITEG
jgi:O-antigen/teichoic acid export membrane protein